MKKIALTGNFYVIIDDEDFNKVCNFKWHISKSGGRVYVRTLFRNINEPTKKVSLFLQHLIVGKPPKGKRLLFKDGNSLNCQKSNLEFISHSVAAHKYYKKVKKNKNATEKFRGVVIQYLARIKYQNRIITLGSFDNEKDAALAYNKKAMELYGDKAVLNNI